MFAVPLFAVAVGILLLFARFTLPNKGNQEASNRANARFERYFPALMFTIFVLVIAIIMYVQTR